MVGNSGSSGSSGSTPGTSHGTSGEGVGGVPGAQVVGTFWIGRDLILPEPGLKQRHSDPPPIRFADMLLHSIPQHSRTVFRLSAISSHSMINDSDCHSSKVWVCAANAPTPFSFSRWRHSESYSGFRTFNPSFANPQNDPEDAFEFKEGPHRTIPPNIDWLNGVAKT